MSAFYFGPLGSMVPLVVSAGVPVQTGRGFSEFVSSGGARYVQQGRSAPRTWTVGRQWQNPDWVRLLSMAAHGMLPDCWLYDVAAARDNMLPAVLSAGGGGPETITTGGEILRRNLLTNPLFSGTPGNGWVTRNGVVCSAVSGWLRATYGPTSNNQIPFNSSAYSTKVGKQYTAAITVRNAGSRTETVTIRHYPGSNGGSDKTSPAVELLPGASARLAVTSGVVPAGETSAQVFLYCTSYLAGSTVLDFKDPVAEEGVVDGGGLNGDMVNGRWEGVPNASTSVITTPVSTVVVPVAQVPVDGVLLPAVKTGHTVRVPVLAGRNYSVSAWCADDAPMLTYQNGAETGTVEAVAGSGSTSILPLRDSILEVKVAHARVSGLRINEGSFDGTFHPGFGTPCRVAVQDPSRTLQMVTGQVRSDYEVTLYEVGKPGTV